MAERKCNDDIHAPTSRNDIIRFSIKRVLEITAMTLGLHHLVQRLFLETHSSLSFVIQTLLHVRNIRSKRHHRLFIDVVVALAEFYLTLGTFLEQPNLLQKSLHLLIHVACQQTEPAVRTATTSQSRCLSFCSTSNIFTNKTAPPSEKMTDSAGEIEMYSAHFSKN